MKQAESTKPQKRERVRSRTGDTDLAFSIVVLILLGLGIVMMFSASYAIAINEGKEGYYYALRQVIFAGIGLVMMFIMSHVDYHIFQKKGFPLIIYGGAVFLLILVLFIGTDLGTGCQRWLNLGVTTFQPSELAKFAIVILFSYLIDQNFERMQQLFAGTVVYLLLLGVIIGLLLLEPHLSCSILIAVIGIALVFVGGAKWRNIGIITVIGVILAGLVLMYLINTKGIGYFQRRIATWFHPFDSDDVDGTWQSRQSLIAIGSGGLFGLGLGESRQKYLYLPESENDFVFSIVCEELGLFGAITVILLFVLLVMQGFHIASHCKDRFGMLVAIGFTLQIGLQAFINIGVVSGFLPNTGISLPFFSYGGTALVMQLMQMGIVLNISRSRQPIQIKKVRPAPEESEMAFPQDA